ncbi:hypothetical protein [Aliiroseovarius sp. YM-037]|uniref:tetratricopeptide repeat protein n=1 Tax=Aliiroseovarius sp. YM-037 TaxID=3341728 RepID=UPI003A809DE9
MTGKRISGVLFALVCLAMPRPASAELLSLNFLPPDLPASNLCGIQVADADPASSEENEGGDGRQDLTEEDRLDFLSRDINSLTRQNPDAWFDFIAGLITYRAELDPEFAGAEEAFARINLYVAAERFDELQQTETVENLRFQADTLTNNQKVKLAHYYLSGVGVAQDRDLALELIVSAALEGNANALLDIVRMQLSGEEMTDWSLSAEQTATMAYGGVIGKLNAGICNRAERLAREYTDGDILSPNPDLAYAWRKFAADMGGKDAAWRVVEHQLNSVSPEKDYEELQRYLNIAIGDFRDIGSADVHRLIDQGARSEADVKNVLGHYPSPSPSLQRRSAVPFLELDLDLETGDQATDSPYLQYLREIAAIPDAPGLIYTRLAKELLLLKGAWEGAAEAVPILEQAVELGEPEAMAILAEILLRDVDDPAIAKRAEQLLIDSVSLHGHAPSMNRLTNLYRCQMPNAPLLAEANYWADTYGATDLAPIRMPATDLARIDATLEPEAVAKIQSLALLGHGSSAANLLQLMQSDLMVSDQTLRFWAERVGRSDRALEDFVRQEFELALTSEQRQKAVEIFRRAYLHIGPAITLDLAVALVKHAGRDPVVSAEIQQLLYDAGQRGEGAAIRLLSRLTKSEGIITYGVFSDAIETRGDFLAFMFAAPFITDEEFDDYMKRAVSIMNCTSKDIAELTDAYVLRGRADEATHWTKIGLTIEEGHILSRLGINEVHRAYFGTGAPEAFEPNDTAPADLATLQRAYLLASNPNARAYDPEGAAGHLVSLLSQSDSSVLSWALDKYRSARRPVQRGVEAQLDIPAVYEQVANSGDSRAMFEYGMHLRTQAEGATDLAQSTDWLRQAAESGLSQAMVEYAYAIGFGLGQTPDPKLAVIWLQKADGLNAPDARGLLDIFNAMTRE